MSTLTKVFVVLLVVFSIAFTVMTVSFAAQTPNWRQLAETYRESATIADTNLRNQIAASAAELAASHDSMRRQMERIGELEKEMKRVEDRVAQLQLEADQVRAEKSSAEAINRGLVAQLQAADTTRTEYRNQRDELERQNVEMRRRNVDLNDRVNELSARVSVLLEQRRQYEQQINILKEENEQLASQAGGGGSGRQMEQPGGLALEGVRSASPVARSTVRGKVVDVANGIVTLSVGSADGVKPGMVFVVHRDDQYLGDVRVDLVEPEQSAGRPVGGSFKAQTGDLATDAAALSSLRG